MNLRYIGGIAYENWHTGSRVKRFEMTDKQTIFLELVSKVTEEGVSDSHFVATAVFIGGGQYCTAWVPLKNTDGSVHPYGSAMFAFKILHHDAEMIKIEGEWHDGDAEKTRYPFTSILHRAPEAEGD